MNDIDGKNWEVWTEGYIITGERQPATFHGIFTGRTFRDAVKQFRDTKCSNPELVDIDRMTYWGCGFYDNESEAREFNG
jgi:hypothetical protein